MKSAARCGCCSQPPRWFLPRRSRSLPTQRMPRLAARQFPKIQRRWSPGQRTAAPGFPCSLPGSAASANSDATPAASWVACLGAFVNATVPMLSWFDMTTPVISPVMSRSAPAAKGVVGSGMYRYCVIRPLTTLVKPVKSPGHRSRAQRWGVPHRPLLCLCRVYQVVDYHSLTQGTG